VHRPINPSEAALAAEMAEMQSSISAIVNSYDPALPLERARTISSDWYVDPGIAEIERRFVFERTWQLAGRIDQLRDSGQFVTARIAGEPVVVVRGSDSLLRGFVNVCQHHAAEVMTAVEGTCSVMRCPYHGWTYGLDGCLKGAPEFDRVEQFDRSTVGLTPIDVDTWERFVFVRIERGGSSLADWASEFSGAVAGLRLGALQFAGRRSYELACNWKVFVDNYLDGGYHVPHIHSGLSGVLDYGGYTVQNGTRHCLQTSPIEPGKGDPTTADVRKGDRAYYYWVYPNFMLNWYEGVMDINTVWPLAVDRCRVDFDFYFSADMDDDERRQASISVADRIQQEDIDVCESVQRGLSSRGYVAGRLAVPREAGEHLFHRLLHADLVRGLGDTDSSR